MERMDMQSRNRYLKVLRERYLKAKAKKEKTEILDEYCRNAGQVRKYVIRKIQLGEDLGPKQRKKRKQTYDNQVTAALAEVWEIFDCPCVRYSACRWYGRCKLKRQPPAIPAWFLSVSLRNEHCDCTVASATL